MKKIMKIEGMMCTHCQNHVQEALNALEGVTAVVDLENKCANIEIESNVDDATLTAAVTKAGYQVVGLE